MVRGAVLIAQCKGADGVFLNTGLALTGIFFDCDYCESGNLPAVIQDVKCSSRCISRGLRLYPDYFPHGVPYLLL